MWNKVPKKISTYTGRCLNILAKPQRKHFLIYITGLIWIIKFRSISEIAREYYDCKTDGLHHFVKNSVKKTTELEKVNQEFIAKSIKRDEETILIIDDTPCPREGKKIEGIGIHHGADGFVKGLCAVTAIIRTSTQQFAWAVKGYYSKKSCPDNFKSKVQLASEIIDETRKHISKPLTILMDAWYTCAPILGKIIEAKWTFVAAIKQNRKIFVFGRETRVRHLAKGRRQYKLIRHSKKRFKIAKQIVYLPKVGEVHLFICKYGAKTNYFISNNLELSERKMVKLYSQRFMIEIFHKDIKQHLGFREIFVRSRHSVQKHWTLLAIAYNIIVLSDSGKHKSFRRKIFHFRDSFSHDSLMVLPNILKMAA